MMPVVSELAISPSSAALGTGLSGSDVRLHIYRTKASNITPYMRDITVYSKTKKYPPRTSAFSQVRKGERKATDRIIAVLTIPCTTFSTSSDCVNRDGIQRIMYQSHG